MDPHFLHGARALDPVLTAPVDQPAAVAWRPESDTLLVASRAGVVFALEPWSGTRACVTLDREPAVLAPLGASGLIVLTVEGLLQRWEGETKRWEAVTGLVTGRALVVTDDTVAVAGGTEAARRVLVFDLDGRRRLKARVPARTAIGTDRSGALIWARSLEGGLFVGPVGDRLATGEATQHQLTIGGGGVVGVTDAGVVVWLGDQAMAVRQGDVGNAALSPDATLLALGTRTGSVALLLLSSPDQRRAPLRVDAHAGPVRGLTFSPKGRWLATIGDRCRLWAYSAPTPSIPPRT